MPHWWAGACSVKEKWCGRSNTKIGAISNYDEATAI